ncbi:hypothetical protein G8D96_21450 [Aeromonas hydrophila]|nr:hypothetical protein [Aeromonas hydrophila]
MTQKVLTKIFESLLNTAAQAPTDDIVNRDGISLMKQGFELIMQAHCEGGATGPTSPLLAEARQLLADIEASQVRGRPLISLATISEQLDRIDAKLPTPTYIGMSQVIHLDGESAIEEAASAARRALHGTRGLHPQRIVLELTR